MGWYNDSSIYILRSPNTDDYFISSTIVPLNECLVGHRGSFKAGTNRPSQSIMSAGDVYISLLEKFSCSSKKELLIQENIVKKNYNPDNHDNHDNVPEPIKCCVNGIDALPLWIKEAYEITGNANDFVKVRDMFNIYRTSQTYWNTRTDERPNLQTFSQTSLLIPLFKKVHNYYIDGERKQAKKVLIGVKLNENTD